MLAALGVLTCVLTKRGRGTVTQATKALQLEGKEGPPPQSFGRSPALPLTRLLPSDVGSGLLDSGQQRMSRCCSRWPGHGDLLQCHGGSTHPAQFLWASMHALSDVLFETVSSRPWLAFSLAWRVFCGAEVLQSVKSGWSFLPWITFSCCAWKLISKSKVTHI